MASFLSILKKIGTVALGVEKVASPIVSTFIPASAPIFSAIDSFVPRVQNSIIVAEANAPTGSGDAKSQAVIDDFEAGLDLTQQVLGLRGEKLTYDKTQLQTAINDFVAGYNAMAAVKTSFKIEKISP